MPTWRWGSIEAVGVAIGRWRTEWPLAGQRSNGAARSRSSAGWSCQKSKTSTTIAGYGRWLGRQEPWGQSYSGVSGPELRKEAGLSDLSVRPLPAAPPSFSGRCRPGLRSPPAAAGPRLSFSAGRCPFPPVVVRSGDAPARPCHRSGEPPLPNCAPLHQAAPPPPGRCAAPPQQHLRLAQAPPPPGAPPTPPL
ncbi:uncharacterized protein LOC131075247 [Cryptomeria japonica]|uniref:uncharacterized protein LOC131075247 n=1 Tax=Cryptomeria japonica TaxID=3369 RepID=UPI0025AD2CE4|nr:uncharacterized protein LOC131075247 [Cryptomeria japonica]